MRTTTTAGCTYSSMKAERCRNAVEAEAVAEGFLLPRDAYALIDAAQASVVPG